MRATVNVSGEMLAVGVLSPQQKKIYEMFIEGYKAKEISELTGISYETVRTQLKRITKKIKNLTSISEIKDDPDIMHLYGKQQQIPYLKRNGYQIKDAAKVLGTSAGTARPYISRGYKAKNTKASPIREYTLTREEMQEIVRKSEERNKPMSPDLVSMCYSLAMEEKKEKIKLICAAIFGAGYWEAKKALLDERAKAFRALTTKGHQTYTYIESDARKIIPDVIEEYFTHVKDATFRPLNGKAQEALQEIYWERKAMLERYGAIALRHVNHGCHAKAYPLKPVNPKTVKFEKTGKVVKIKEKSLIIETDDETLEVNTEEIIISQNSSYYSISHMAARIGDVVNIGGEMVYIKDFIEEFPIRLITGKTAQE